MELCALIALERAHGQQQKAHCRDAHVIIGLATATVAHHAGPTLLHI